MSKRKVGQFHCGRASVFNNKIRRALHWIINWKVKEESHGLRGNSGEIYIYSHINKDNDNNKNDNINMSILIFLVDGPPQWSINHSLHCPIINLSKG